jgi:hypothetical protein
MSRGRLSVFSVPLIPNTLIHKLIERTSGVPLFVEELTRALLESGQSTPEAHAIPETLHDSLMARLVRLGTAKEIAQLGAVIGAEFTYELLHAARRIQQLVQGYRRRAGITQAVHPHLFRHQMITWATSHGLSDAQTQLISGHESKKSLEVYQHLASNTVEHAYQEAVRSIGI